MKMTDATSQTQQESRKAACEKTHLKRRPWKIGSDGRDVMCCSIATPHSQTDEHKSNVYRMTERRHKDAEHEFLYKRRHVRHRIIVVVNELGFLTETDSLQRQRVL